MISIPMQVNDLLYDLFVILEDENIERIKNYDPAEIVTQNMPKPWRSMSIRNVILMRATSEEMIHITSLHNFDDVKAAIKNLSRGWKYKPKSGDNDGSYQMLGKQ